MKNKVNLGICTSLFFLFFLGGVFHATTAVAWHANGFVFCDANSNSEVDSGDIPLGNVVVNVEGLTCSDFAWSITRDQYDTQFGYDMGSFYVSLQDYACDYVEYLHEPSIPFADWWYVIPPSGEHEFSITGTWPNTQNYMEWLIDSPECHPDQGGACWLTAGGVKFSNVTGQYMDEYKTKGPPQHSWGGNVNPACAPNKGHWNHIKHKDNPLHFQATDLEILQCGNVPGIEPGSESPVTPVNFIEFTGPATLKGIGGNKMDYGSVCFFARAEDRNEPGSRGAKDGSDVDRYFLHVYDCTTQETLLLVDVDGDPATVDPITITGGNMQMHFNPCEN